MGFFKALLNDADKRVNPMVVVTVGFALASIVWVSFLVAKNHVLPELSGIAELLGGTGLANAAHKAEDIVARFKDPGPPQNGQPPVVPPPMVPPQA